MSGPAEPATPRGFAMPVPGREPARQRHSGPPGNGGNGSVTGAGHAASADDPAGAGDPAGGGGPRLAGETVAGARPATAPPAGGAVAEAPLADDAMVEIAAEQRKLAISSVLDRLDRELVGLAPVKTRVREIAALLLVDGLRNRYGLSSSRPTLHMCFTGSPGTGKTTVAIRMAELLKGLGYLRRGHLVTVTRDDLVGEYVGHTAPRTKSVLARAMGGVLFIDEAYYLYRAANERDYGQEAIEILLQVMEAERDDLVVILAGYRDRMDAFFRSNPGLASRIAHHIDFPDFTAGELMRIAELLVERERYRLSPAARQAFAEYIERRMRQPRFANARSVRNAIDRIRLRQANRLVSAGAQVGKDDLIRIEADDIRRSRVFTSDHG